MESNQPSKVSGYAKEAGGAIKGPSHATRPLPSPHPRAHVSPSRP